MTSLDGTELAARVSGEGPPLVLVHGAAASMDSWALVEPTLAAHHTVWTYDRRGRGASTDVHPYEFEREVEDLLAVVARAGDGVHLVAHSFGARCALEAAPRLELDSLTLYEPPVHVASKGNLIDEAARHIDEGRMEEGLVLFLREIAGLSEDEISTMRSVPRVWERFLAAAPSAARELRALVVRDLDPTEPMSMGIPTLYLRGGDTSCDSYLSRQEQQTLLPDAECVVLPGQRHIAFATDPDAFASVILSFTRRCRAEDP